MADGEQRVYSIQLVVRATEAEAAAIGDRIGEVVCIPPDHSGPCVTPWVLVRGAVDDYDEPERSNLLALLEDEE